LTSYQLIWEIQAIVGSLDSFTIPLVISFYPFSASAPRKSPGHFPPCRKTWGAPRVQSGSFIELFFPLMVSPQGYKLFSLLPFFRSLSATVTPAANGRYKRLQASLDVVDPVVSLDLIFCFLDGGRCIQLPLCVSSFRRNISCFLLFFSLGSPLHSWDFPDCPWPPSVEFSVLYHSSPHLIHL